MLPPLLPPRQSLKGPTISFSYRHCPTWKNGALGVARNSDERNSWLKIGFKRSNSGWNRIGGICKEMGAREGRDLVGVIRVNTSNNERPRKDEVT